METMRIFLASGAELAAERDAVELEIQRKNSLTIQEGLFLEVVRWEQLRKDFGKERAQEHYSSEISNSDVVIVLFARRVGKYTREEFYTAYELFKSRDKPSHLYVLFKKITIPIEQIDRTILKVKQLRGEIEKRGQMFMDFESIPELRYLIREQLDIIIQEWLDKSGLFHISQESIETEARVMLDIRRDGAVITDKRKVKKIAERCRMFNNWQTNRELKFQEGDISYFTGNFNEFSLETQFRARKLILEEADARKLTIPSQGDLSHLAKPIERRLRNTVQALGG